MTALDRFLDACAREIERRCAAASSKRAELTAGHLALTVALDGAAPTGRELSSVPVAEWVDRLPSSPLADAARAARGELSWVPSSRLDDAGTEAALAPLNDVRSLPGIVAGLMLLRPHGVYPVHAHAPQELYLPICGDGDWRFGGSEDFRRLGDDELIYNHPNDVHSVVAGEAPLLALYVLWGDGIEAFA